MKITLAWAFGLFTFAAATNGQNLLTGTEIYRLNREAVVQIGTGNNFLGDGFIISPDGVIITANHVITTQESSFRQYLPNITVRIVRNGIANIVPAVPISAQISDDQVNFDSARIKIAASGLSHVTLGDWGEVDVGSQITILSSVPEQGIILMLQGPVSAKAPVANGLGPKLVETIWFHCPVRRGFSGSPIFNDKGHVIGIVDTKVFGISPALDDIRKKWMNTQTGPIRVQQTVMGVDIAQYNVELINNLDMNLISGLGSGVAIEYAKKQQEAKGK